MNYEKDNTKSSRLIWTKDRCACEAEKHLTKKQWKLASNGSYQRALKMNWMDELTAHMTSERVFWNKDKIMAVVKSCVDYNEFMSTKTYTAATNRKMLDEIKEYYGGYNSFRDAALKSMVKRGVVAGFDYDYSRIYETYTGVTNSVLIGCKTHGWVPCIVQNHGRNNNGGCVKCSKGGISLPEQELFDYIKSLKKDAVQSEKIILNGKEIDIYIPSLKIGFEYNGLIYHSKRFGKTKNYHQIKTVLAKEQGVRLIHIWEDEYINNKDKIKAFIKMTLLGCDQKVFARKTKIFEIESKVAKEFHDTNHLQGNLYGKSYGVFFKDDLVGVATIRKRKDIFELARWTVKSGVVIVGGLSKVMTYIGKPVVSYCDTAKHTGDGYLKAGFKHVGSSSGAYWYTDGIKRFNRIGFQKHKLIEKNAKGNTEEEMAESLGYYVIGGCDQLKFTYGDVGDVESKLQIDDSLTVELKNIKEKNKYKTLSDSELILEAKKYKTRLQLKKGNHPVYSELLNRDIDSVAFSNMPKPGVRRSYLEKVDYIIDSIFTNNYIYKSDLKHNKDNRTEEMARKINVIDSLFLSKKVKTYTVSSLTLMAKKFSNQYDFRLANNGAYQAIIRLNIKDIAFAHMS